MQAAVISLSLYIIKLITASVHGVDVIMCNLQHAYIITCTVSMQTTIIRKKKQELKFLV